MGILSDVRRLYAHESKEANLAAAAAEDPPEIDDDF